MFLELDYTCGVNETSYPKLCEDVLTAPDAYAAADGAHAIAILTEWDEFKTLDFKKIYASMVKPAFLFDGRNLLDHEPLRAIGFDVYVIGKKDEQDPFL